MRLAAAATGKKKKRAFEQEELVNNDFGFVSRMHAAERKIIHWCDLLCPCRLPCFCCPLVVLWVSLEMETHLDPAIQNQRSWSRLLEQQILHNQPLSCQQVKLRYLEAKTNTEQFRQTLKIQLRSSKHCHHSYESMANSS